MNKKSVFFNACEKRYEILKNASQVQVKIQIVFYRPFIKTDIKKHIIYTAKAIQRECCIFPDLNGSALLQMMCFFVLVYKVYL